MARTRVGEPSNKPEGGFEGAEGLGGLACDVLWAKPKMLRLEELDANLSVNFGGHANGEMRPERQVRKPARPLA